MTTICGYVTTFTLLEFDVEAIKKLTPGSKLLDHRQRVIQVRILNAPFQVHCPSQNGNSIKRSPKQVVEFHKSARSIV